MTRLHLALAILGGLLLLILGAGLYWLIGEPAVAVGGATGAAAGGLAIRRAARLEAVERSTSLVDTLPPVERDRARAEDAAIDAAVAKKSTQELIDEWRG